MVLHFWTKIAASYSLYEPLLSNVKLTLRPQRTRLPDVYIKLQFYRDPSSIKGRPRQKNGYLNRNLTT